MGTWNSVGVNGGQGQSLLQIHLQACMHVMSCLVHDHAIVYVGSGCYLVTMTKLAGCK